MPRRAPRRLALLTAALMLALLCVGGVVTSRDAGMVFSDWPLADGSVNPDGWLRDADKASEHGHRILGAAVGLLATALLLWTWRADPRRGVRALALAAWLAVGGQGLLGGLRVTETSDELALLHGCAGQLVFCLFVALAYLTARGAPRETAGDTRALASAAALSFLLIALQVVL
ncbi:MAG: COX15/CtaA family protein, partial [Anaerolineales bacterium]